MAVGTKALRVVLGVGGALLAFGAGSAGAGGPAIPLVSPDSINFGNLTVGTPSSPSTVQVRNAASTGNASVTVSTPAISGSAASDYAITNDNCAPYPRVLPSGQTSCTFDVVFTPTAAATRSATVSISTSQLGPPPLRVALFGTGVADADAVIKRPGDSAYIGDGVINTDAAGQTLSAKTRRGQTKTFDLQVQADDGHVAIALDGCSSTNRFKVSYFDGASSNITDAVAAGTYQASYNNGDAKQFQMRVRPFGSKAKPGKILLCKVLATGDSVTDAVAAKVTIKR